MPSTIGIHEAADVLEAHVLGIAVRSASIRAREAHLGMSRFDASGEEPPLDCAVVFAAGSMAERMLTGSPERINWLNLDDFDIDPRR